MKHYGRSDFAQAEPASLSARLVARTPLETGNPDHVWLASLPIAAAIFRLSEGLTGDMQGTKLAANSRFDALLQGNGRAQGLNLADFADCVAQMAAEDRTTHFAFWRSADKVNRCELEISIARFGAQDDFYLVSVVDRTAEAISRINLRREMLNDSLTGFYNRTGFEERLEELVAAADNGSRYAIIIFDLARFSRINESVGVIAGDELIITVAHRLNSRIRSNEQLARLNGNEFALFAQIENDGAVESIAKRIAQAFADPCKLSNLEIQIECATSAALGTIGQDDPMDTLRHAQIVMKRAKRTKRLELFSEDKLHRATNRFAIETDLRRAIASGALDLHYQPLIDLESGELSGFEALARWEHPDRGWISPMEFIPVAEESGLIVPLGRWALDRAAQTIANWDAKAGKTLPVRISVNLSAVQIQRDDVAVAVEDAIRGAQISGNRLTLELTESAFVDDPDGARRVLESLKALDANLAMDDFGTGYSNLAYLQKLPIDVLKIDRSFVTDMDANKDNEAIVSTILSLANALGMKTTAEGIETEAISAALKKLGCTNGQGYYFARPLTFEAAYAFLSESMAATR
jgi:diguanylate cyclase (GGDEF)-like protein